MSTDALFRSYTDLLRAYLPFAPPAPLDPSDRLADLGIDSLNTVELLARIEESFGVEFPDELLTADTFATVGSLWSALSGLLGLPHPGGGTDRQQPGGYPHPSQAHEVNL